MSAHIDARLTAHRQNEYVELLEAALALKASNKQNSGDNLKLINKVTNLRCALMGLTEAARCAEETGLLEGQAIESQFLRELKHASLTLYDTRSTS